MSSSFLSIYILSVVFCLIIVNAIMGYNILEYDYQNKLEKSLRASLKQENCASTTHLVNIVDQSRCRAIPPETKILRWLNEEDKTISISLVITIEIKLSSPS
jgi:hypothetical protein